MKSPTSADPARKPKARPIVIRSGDCEVKIYHTPTTVRGQAYDRYTLSYFANGKRVRSRSSDFSTAKLKATLISTSLPRPSVVLHPVLPTWNGLREVEPGAGHARSHLGGSFARNSVA